MKRWNETSLHVVDGDSGFPSDSSMQKLVLVGGGGGGGGASIKHTSVRQND